MGDIVDRQPMTIVMHFCRQRRDPFTHKVVGTEEAAAFF